MIRRLALSLALAVVAAPLIGAGLSAPRTAAAQEGTSVFVEGAAAAAGSVFETAVIAVVAGEGVTAFELRLHYDPALLRPRATRLQPGWVETPAASGAATWTVAARAVATGCPGSGTCLLAEVEWDALAQGDTRVRAEVVSLVGPAGIISGVRDGEGTVTISPLSPTLVPGDESSGLGAGNALAVVGLSLLAGAAVAGPVAVVVRRARTRRARGPEPRPLAPQVQAELGPRLVEAVGGYFDEIEVEGLVFETPDRIYEQMAREATVRDPGR